MLPPNGDGAGGGRWASMWEKEEVMVGPSGASDSSLYTAATLVQ